MDVERLASMPLANGAPRGDRPVRMNRGLLRSVHVRWWISHAGNDLRVQFFQEGEAGPRRRQMQLLPPRVVLAPLHNDQASPLQRQDASSERRTVHH